MLLHRAAEDFTLMFCTWKARCSGCKAVNAFGSPAHGNVDRWTLLSAISVVRLSKQRNSFCVQTVSMKDFVPISNAVDGIIHLSTVNLPSIDIRIFNVKAAIASE